MFPLAAHFHKFDLGKDFTPFSLPANPICLGLGPAQGRDQDTNHQHRGSWIVSSCGLSYLPHNRRFFLWALNSTHNLWDTALMKVNKENVNIWSKAHIRTKEPTAQM